MNWRSREPTVTGLALMLSTRPKNGSEKLLNRRTLPRERLWSCGKICVYRFPLTKIIVIIVSVFMMLSS